MTFQKTKRMLCGCVALAISAAVLCGCQPTPEEPIVVNKNDGKLEEKIAETVEEEQVVVEEKATLKWTEEIETRSSITLDIDAEVVIPEVKEFPVVRVRPRGFTDEEIQNAVAYLSDGATIYENTSGTTTKEDYQELILQRKKDIADTQASIESGENKNPYAEDNIQVWTDEVKWMERAYSSAPSRSEIETTEIPLKDVNDRNEMLMNDGIMFDTGKGRNAVFSIYDDREEFNKCVMRFYNESFDGGYTDEHYQKVPARGMKMTEEEARRLAEETLAGMGIKDFGLSETLVCDKYYNSGVGSDENQQAYRFYYTRNVNGVAAHYIQFHSWKSANNVEGGSAEEYRPGWTPEYIAMVVDDTGIYSFDWFNPVEILAVENENVQIIDLEQAKQIFSENMDRIVSGFEMGEVDMLMLKVKVNKVVLGFQYLPVKDHFDEYRMTPCWIFMGNDSIFAIESWISGPCSQMTLNAIDGSIL